MSAKPFPDLTNIKQVTQPRNAIQRERARIQRQMGQLIVPQYTSIAAKQVGKQQPASSRFATI